MHSQVKSEKHGAPTQGAIGAATSADLSAALDALGQGYAIFGSDLRLREWNRSFAAIMELPDGLVRRGLEFEAFIAFRAERGDYGDHPSDDVVKRRVALARSNRRRKLEHILPGGRIVESLSTPLSGGGFVSLFTDVTERRSAEMALSASQEEAAAAQQVLSDAIESLPEGFALYDSDDRLVLCNERFRELLSACADILIPGTPYEDIVHAMADRAAVRDATVDVEEWRADRLEMWRSGGGSFQYATENGRWIRALDRRTADGGMVSIRMDITTLKQRERELAQSEERTAAAWRSVSEAIESLGEGFAIFDADDRLMLCNESMRRILPQGLDDLLQPGVGYEEVLDEMIAGGRFKDAIGREDAWKAERLEHRRSLHEPFEYQIDNGRWVRAIDRRTPDGGTVSIRLDVTEVRRRERELREQSELLETTLASMGQGIMVVGPDLYVRQINDRAREMLNLPPDLARAGVHAESLVRYSAERGDFGEADVEAQINERLTSFIAPDPMVSDDRGADGRHIQVRRNPMPGGGSVNTYTDVTAQAEAEALVRDSEERYRQLVEQMPDCVVIHDGRTVKYVNSAGARMFGAGDPAELLGLPIVDFIHPDWRAQSVERQRRVLVGGEDLPFTELTLLTRDGAPIEVELAAHRFEHDGASAVQNIIRDITERKRAEAELRRSQAEATEARRTLVEAIDSLSEGFALYDHEDRLVICNDRYRECYPLTAPVIEPGVTFEELIRYGAEKGEYADAAGNEAAWIEDRLERHRNPSGMPYEQRFPDGRCLSVVESATPSGGVAGLRVDITGRKEVEERLRESEKRHRQFLEQTPEAIVVHDGERILYGNPASAVLLGVEDPAELQERSVYDFIHPDWEEAARELLPELLAGDIELPKSEWHLVAADGRDIEVEVHAHRFEYLGRPALQNIIRDIGPEKEAQARLRESEERHRGLVEQLPDAVIVHDGYYILYGNPAALRMLGAGSAAELQSHTLEDITPPEAWPAVKKYIDEGLAQGESSPLIEGVMLRLDGQPIDVELLGQPFDHQGTRYAQVVARDITAQKRAAVEQKRLEDELRQAQKMEAVGTLAGGIAHDFNNVLGAMLGYAELTMDDIAEDSPAHDNLSHILTAGRRAQELVGQILAFSRREHTTVGPVYLAEVVEEVVGLLQGSLPKSIEIESRIDAPDAVIEGRTGQIHQVLMNLCTNGAHALGGRPGRLSVTLRQHRQERVEETVTGSLYPNDYFVVEVADTGSGIPTEVAARMFDPFFTTKEVGEGTGMGLAVVHGIVGDHGGRVDVDTTPGEGTTFRVYLPRAGSNNRAQDEAAARPAMSGEGRVLVVDDEPMIADMTGKMLSRLGYHPECVTNGLEALTILRQRIDDFDLVLTDQTMPNVTGDMIIDEVRRLSPDLPVILCSGYGRALSTTEAADIGASAFLSKPFKPSELGEVVQQALSDISIGDTQR